LYPLELRPVQEQDCELIWKWVNEQEVRKSAFHSEPIDWETHKRWFLNKMRDPQCFHFIAVGSEGTPVGQVRFDITDNSEAHIDISIDKDKRARGCGSNLIRSAVEKMTQMTFVTAVHAQVKRENIFSIRAFESAGFEIRDEEVIKGSPAVHMIWYRNGKNA
jgi:UDP-2,4-diacetamido-2,4,6-trideoxy-beta-L-altropyranose hydrolase